MSLTLKGCLRLLTVMKIEYSFPEKHNPNNQCNHNNDRQNSSNSYDTVY